MCSCTVRGIPLQNCVFWNHVSCFLLPHELSGANVKHKIKITHKILLFCRNTLIQKRNYSWYNTVTSNSLKKNKSVIVFRVNNCHKNDHNNPAKPGSLVPLISFITAQVSLFVLVSGVYFGGFLVQHRYNMKVCLFIFRHQLFISNKTFPSTLFDIIFLKQAVIENVII